MALFLLFASCWRLYIVLMLICWIVNICLLRFYFFLFVMSRLLFFALQTNLYTEASE